MKRSLTCFKNISLCVAYNSTIYRIVLERKHSVRDYSVERNKCPRKPVILHECIFSPILKWDLVTCFYRKCTLMHNTVTNWPVTDESQKLELRKIN